MIILIPIVLLVLAGLLVHYQHRHGYYRGDITLEEDERRWARYYQKGGK